MGVPFDKKTAKALKRLEKEFARAWAKTKHKWLFGTRRKKKLYTKIKNKYFPSIVWSEVIQIIFPIK